MAQLFHRSSVCQKSSFWKVRERHRAVVGDSPDKNSIVTSRLCSEPQGFRKWKLPLLKEGMFLFCLGFSMCWELHPSVVAGSLLLFTIPLAPTRGDACWLLYLSSASLPAGSSQSPWGWWASKCSFSLFSASPIPSRCEYDKIASCLVLTHLLLLSILQEAAAWHAPILNLILPNGTKYFHPLHLCWL